MDLERISRREALKVFTAFALTLIVGGCEKEAQLQTRRILSGETKDLTFFQLANQLANFTAHINEPVLKVQSEIYKFPLYDPSTLRVDFSPTGTYDSGSDFDVVTKSRSSTLGIAVGGFIDTLEDASEDLSLTTEGERVLSTVTSLALFLGHLQIAHNNNDLSRNEVLEKYNLYGEFIENAEKQDLIVLLSHDGLTKPTNLDQQNALAKLDLPWIANAA